MSTLGLICMVGLFVYALLFIHDLKHKREPIVLASLGSAITWLGSFAFWNVVF